MHDEYRAARKRHAGYRRMAYEIVREEAIRIGLCGDALRLADIDADALRVWRSTWSGRHPHRAGAWDWELLVDQMPARPAVLPVAIWYGSDLCGLLLGHASARRTSGVRHTVVLTHAERRPEPPDVPLRGSIIRIAAATGRTYGRALGASRLRLAKPDRRLLGWYERLGVGTVWKNGRAIYCEQEIRR